MLNENSIELNINRKKTEIILVAKKDEPKGIVTHRKCSNEREAEIHLFPENLRQKYESVQKDWKMILRIWEMYEAFAK